MGVLQVCHRSLGGLFAPPPVLVAELFLSVLFLYVAVWFSFLWRMHRLVVCFGSVLAWFPVNGYATSSFVRYGYPAVRLFVLWLCVSVVF